MVTHAWVESFRKNFKHDFFFDLPIPYFHLYKRQKTIFKMVSRFHETTQRVLRAIPISFEMWVGVWVAGVQEMNEGRVAAYPVAAYPLGEATFFQQTNNGVDSYLVLSNTLFPTAECPRCLSVMFLLVTHRFAFALQMRPCHGLPLVFLHRAQLSLRCGSP